MMTPTRKRLLELLGELCDASPDVRFGQLLAHLGFLTQDRTDRTLWDADDQQLLAVFRHHQAELAERNENVVSAS